MHQVPAALLHQVQQQLLVLLIFLCYSVDSSDGQNVSSESSTIWILLSVTIVFIFICALCCGAGCTFYFCYFSTGDSSLQNDDDNIKNQQSGQQQQQLSPNVSAYGAPGLFAGGAGQEDPESMNGGTDGAAAAGKDDEQQEVEDPWPHIDSDSLILSDEEKSRSGAWRGSMPSAFKSKTVQDWPKSRLTAKASSRPSTVGIGQRNAKSKSTIAARRSSVTTSKQHQQQPTMTTTTAETLATAAVALDALTPHLTAQKRPSSNKPSHFTTMMKEAVHVDESKRSRSRSRKRKKKKEKRPLKRSSSKPSSRRPTTVATTATMTGRSSKSSKARSRSKTRSKSKPTSQPKHSSGRGGGGKREISHRTKPHSHPKGKSKGKGSSGNAGHHHHHQPHRGHLSPKPVGHSKRHSKKKTAPRKKVSPKKHAPTLKKASKKAVSHKK